MEDKYELVFTSNQLVLLDAALWSFISEYKYKSYKINDDDFNKFVQSISKAYELRKYINSNIPNNND